jgi:ribosome maturation factor RimP
MERTLSEMPNTERVERHLIGAATQPAIQRAWEAIEPIVTQAGLTLVGVERAQEGRRLTLWVYLDHPDGITLEQCGEVSPEVSAALDVVDPIAEAYDLRVSSPGLDRPLMSSTDFERFLGRTAQIRLMSPLQGRRKFKGEIKLVEGAEVHVECDGTVFKIPFALILRARLHYSDEDLRAILR